MERVESSLPSGDETERNFFRRGCRGGAPAGSRAEPLRIEAERLIRNNMYRAVFQGFCPWNLFGYGRNPGGWGQRGGTGKKCSFP